MTEGTVPYARTRAAVVAGLVLVLVIAIAAALYLNQREPECCANVTSNAAGEAKEPLTARWKTYLHVPYALSLLVPSGMSVCEETEGFTIRNDGCESSSKPTYTIWQRVAWDGLAEIAAFDDAYAQQLKEAGISSVAGKGTEQSGEKTSMVMLTLSNALVGTIVSDKALPTSVWKVAVDINREAPPVLKGVSASADEITNAVLTSMSFAVKKEKKASPKETDAWQVFTSGSGDFRISYPPTAKSYVASPAAALSVITSAGSKLEVRAASSVDATRPSTAGYRKLTETTISVNGAPLQEERYIPAGVPNAEERILFVSFTKGSNTVGVSFIFSGSEAEETLFGKILDSFTFTASE